MKNALLILLLFYSCSGIKTEEQIIIVPSAEKIRQMAIDESLVPIRPGIPGKISYWNTYAKRFIYAPSFEFKEIEGANEYKFIVVADDFKNTFSFSSDKPWKDLSSIWTKIPVGAVNLKVEAVRNGKIIGRAGEKTFYKASPFHGPYHEVDQTYKESVSQLMNYLFNAPYIKYWLSDKKPDMDYGLHSYPSKMFSAVIQGMLMYADMTKDIKQKNESVQIACITADYLIRISQPEGSPLEYFPPTYTGPIYADMDKVYRGESLADRMMLIYPALTASAYLDLFDKTKNQNYFEAAIKIAETYKRIQLENGSWYLLSFIENGLPVTENYVIPIGILNLMERLKEDYNISEFESCSKRALLFIKDNIVRGFNWEGQFEDQKPSEMYMNLSKGQACSYTLYLLKNSNDQKIIDQA